MLNFCIRYQRAVYQTKKNLMGNECVVSGKFGQMIAVDSNNHIHVVWSDETPGNFEIYYKKGIQ
jgi:hypothetical protein